MIKKTSSLFGTISPFYSYTIDGSSMMPTLSAGDSVLVNRFAYIFAKPSLEDVVAVRDPRDQKVLIKRITAIKGKHYFVEGDNKNHSTDSRVFGMIGKENILGKVIFIQKRGRLPS